VTGAGGKTGSLVFKKLLQNKEFEPVGLIHSPASITKLLRLGANKDSVINCDITDIEQLRKAFSGAERVIICTSAVLSFNTFADRNYSGELIGQSNKPSFTFAKGGDP